MNPLYNLSNVPIAFVSVYLHLQGVFMKLPFYNNMTSIIVLYALEFYSVLNKYT